MSDGMSASNGKQQLTVSEWEIGLSHQGENQCMETKMKQHFIS